MYNVVFEYTLEAGGFAGIRTWTDYNSRRGFKRSWQPDSHQIILKEGVSDQEAMEMTSATREVCRIKAAIEKAFNIGYFSSNLFYSYHLPMATMAIQFDRERLGRPAYFQGNPHQLDEAQELSEKESLFAIADACSNTETGQIDLVLFSLALEERLTNSLIDQLHNLEKDLENLE